METIPRFVTPAALETARQGVFFIPERYRRFAATAVFFNHERNVNDGIGKINRKKIT